METSFSILWSFCAKIWGVERGLLKEVVRELDEVLRGGVISRIHQPEQRTITIRVFRGREYTLLISCHPLFCRIHLTTERFKNPPVPPRFCALLRSRIQNQRILRIDTLEGERIVHIRFKDYILVAELTGKSSNLILVDTGWTVVDALRHFPPGDSKRVVFPGTKLTPLPRPENIEEKPIALEKGPGESWNDAMDRYYTELTEKERFQKERTLLGRALRDARKRAERRIKNILADRERAERELDYGRLGELLLSNFHLLKRGMSEIELDDIYKTPPQKIRIELDPSLSPQQNAERYFKRSRKAKKTLETVAQRLPVAEEELRYIEELTYELENIQTTGELDELRDVLIKEGYLKPPLQPALECTRRRKGPPSVGRLSTEDGFTILYGKNSRANDLILRELTADEDLWFHAKGVPGSHVVRKLAGRRPTEEAIKYTAGVAAFLSKSRGAKKVEVIFTEARNVKKPKGARPGLVTVREYRTIVTEPVPLRNEEKEKN